MRRIGVLTSGGDAPGMNACVRAVVRAAVRRGLDVYGIRRGFAGMIAGEMEPMDSRSVANIIHRGGTILGTSRSKEFQTPEGRLAAREALRAHGIEGLVLIGGEGTFKGGRALAEEGGPPSVGVPGTIDNDVAGTDDSIGFDTAVNTALEAVDRIRDTAFSHERVHFIEVMGRSSGWIALACGVAGGAEAVLVPETPTDLDGLCERIEAGLARGKRGAIVVVAEGDEPGAAEVAESVGARLGGETVRVSSLGHIQRGGAPTAADRILASRLGAAAVEALVEGRTGQMVGIVGRALRLTPFERTWTESRRVDPALEALVDLLA